MKDIKHPEEHRDNISNSHVPNPRWNKSPTHQNGRCIYLRAYVVTDRKTYNISSFLDLLLRLTDSVSSYKFLKKAQVPRQQYGIWWS